MLGSRWKMKCIMFEIFAKVNIADASHIKTDLYITMPVSNFDQNHCNPFINPLNLNNYNLN